MSAITGIVVDLVKLLQQVARSETMPPWVKKFVSVLIVFGIQVMLQLIQIVVVGVLVQLTGIGKTLVGSALFLLRLRALTRMGAVVARCVGSQLCRRLATWIVQNPDCALEAGSTVAAYGLTGAPNVLSVTGAATASVDAGFLAKECLDRNPSGSNRFTHGSSSSSADPPVPGTSRPDMRAIQELGRQGELAAGIVQNTRRMYLPDGRYRVPDGWTGTEIIEVKNVAQLSYTSQLRDFVSYAQANNLTFVLYVRPSTIPSGPLLQAVRDQQIVVKPIGSGPLGDAWR